MKQLATQEPIDLIVVDEDEEQYTSLAASLVSAGMQMAHAIDGHSALQIVAARPPQLWLANMILDDMSGIELMHLVRAKRRVVPFYLVSDAYHARDEVAARAAGATGYLSKPVNETWTVICLEALAHRMVRAGPHQHAPPPHSPVSTHLINTKPPSY